MKNYLVKELSQTGTEIGEFLAQEVAGKDSTSKTKARAEEFFESKQQEQEHLAEK